MKKMMVLGCLILLLASMAWAQERVEAPAWNVGDKWTYKFTKGSTWTNEVVDVKEGLFIAKIGGSRDLFAYDGKTMNLKFLIDESGRRVNATSPFRKILDFPIFVNKKWNDTIISKPARETVEVFKEVTFVNDFKIESIEVVTTTEGKFEAYKIYYKQTNMSSNKSGWVRYWYCPEVKAWVKREAEKSEFWLGVSSAQDAELISYKLK